MSGWPPREQRLRGELFQGKRRLRWGKYLQAALAFERAAKLAEGDEREPVRGLLHLAVAGYRQARGDEVRAQRQFAHACRRLGSAPEPIQGVDVSGLLEAVEAR